MLEHFLARGIVNWGTPVSSILEDGTLFIQQARATDTSGLVSVLLEGPPNSGKTALAAQLAKSSDFPFVKVCTPEEMVGFTESAKCLHIRKVGALLYFFLLAGIEKNLYSVYTLYSEFQFFLLVMNV